MPTPPIFTINALVIYTPNMPNDELPSLLERVARVIGFDGDYVQIKFLQYLDGSTHSILNKELTSDTYPDTIYRPFALQHFHPTMLTNEEMIEFERMIEQAQENTIQTPEDV